MFILLFTYIYLGSFIDYLFISSINIYLFISYTFIYYLSISHSVQHVFYVASQSQSKINW